MYTKYPMTEIDEDESPTPNLSLLRKVLDHIDAAPDLWDQINWSNGCNTTHCVGGWAAALSGDVVNGIYSVSPNGSVYYVSERAQQLLGLTEAEADSLFKATNDRYDIEFYANEIANRAGELF